MERIQILFITFSNTVKENKLLFIEFPITVRAWNWELEEGLKKIIGGDRPKAIIYDGNFPVTENLKNLHEDIMTLVSQSDVDCQYYSYENDLKLPGSSVLTFKNLRKLTGEIKEPG